MRKALAAVLVLAGVQGLLLGGYLLFGRDAGPAPAVHAQELDGPAPELSYRTVAGEERRLSTLRGRPVLVHFWATWCPPCRDELPGLLELAASGEIAVLAVSMDRSWDLVRRFLGGRVPASVVMASSEAAARDFGVTELPRTFLVDAAGRLRLGFAGARDWRSGALREIVRAP